MVVPLIGYVDRFSGRPGERIAIKVSSQFDAPYQADMVRIVHADANPAGPAASVDPLRARLVARSAKPAARSVGNAISRMRVAGRGLARSYDGRNGG